MSHSAARANSAPVATSLGHRQLARMLDGWARGNGTLHALLTERLRQLVQAGALPAGTRLPSERTVAEALSVSRNTVGAAFDQLRAEGLLSSRRGAGTYVSLAGLHTFVRGDDRLRSFVSASASTDAALDLAEAPVDLRSAALPGLPMVAAEFEGLEADDLRNLIATHGYFPGGLPQLRDAVARYYCDLGLRTTAEQVLITSGAQQALRIAAATLLEPQAAVLIEEPSFRGAIEVLRAVGARLIPVPSGADGVDVAQLGKSVREHRPALILLQSTVHNPTGSVLSVQARRAVAQLDVPILDDTSLADTIATDPMPTVLAAFGGHVITIGSASKSFWGGLRVGWLRAEPALIETLASVKGGDDLGTSVISQVLTTRLLSRIDEARTQRATALGAAARDVLATVAELLPAWEPQPPTGGASLWVRLPRPCATAFAQRAQRAGVALLPGPTFSCADRLDDHLRIGFAAPFDEVYAGLRRLADVWRHFD